MLAQITSPHTDNTYLFPSCKTSSDVQQRKDRTEFAVIRFVRKLGIRPNLLGYKLLISSIITALEYPDTINSLTHELYPIVAAMHSCNVRAVERNIRRAIESAYEYDPERIRSVFYYKVDKPYISEVISLAAESVRFELSAESRYI